MLSVEVLQGDAGKGEEEEEEEKEKKRRETSRQFSSALVSGHLL
jgi:hypothetical protein